jgi:thiol-disulfide isomerase/thioredoxin
MRWLLALSCGFSGGCGSETHPPSTQPTPAPTSRTDAVAAAPKKEIGVKDFCEAQPNTAFQYPELDGETPPVAGFTWVNVWATWCAPCLEEMPMLTEWEKSFQAQGAPVDLVFVSVDQKAEDLTKFKETHPNLPETLHAKSLKIVPAWLKSLGVDEDAALPIHMMVGKDGKLLCVRQGQMGQQYFDVIKGMATAGG